MVWVIAFGELFFGDLWCVVWGYGGMRTHFSLLNPQWDGLSDKKCVRSVCRRVGPFYLMGPFRSPMLCWYSVGIALS